MQLKAGRKRGRLYPEVCLGEALLNVEEEVREKREKKQRVFLPHGRKQGGEQGL